MGLGLFLACSAGICCQREAEAQRAPAIEPLARRSTLSFEPNRGQLEARVRYLARGRGYALYLTRDGATLALSRSQARATADIPTAGDPERRVVSMHVVGGRRVEPVGEQLLTSTSNYFVGNDRTRWQSGVENYARVRYEDVLPGVTVVYYGNAERELEYDLLLAAHTNPRGIEIAFDGVSSIQLESDGSATLHLPDGATLRKPAPVAYQVDASGKANVIPSRFELRPGNGLGFVLGAHDEARELRIDPALQYSTYLGGSSFDQSFGAATDPAGNTYVVGYTSSTLFPTIVPLQPSLAGGVYDVFICKLSPTGVVLYSTFLGGSGADLAYAVAADAAGNAYVTGVTFSTDFPTVAPLQAVAGGKQDVFVAKLNSSGSALVYSTYLGGSNDDYAQGIAVGGFGNAYLVGTTFSSNFPKAGARQSALNGTSDAFVTDLAPAGNALVYSTYLGGSNGETGYGIAVDASGEAFVVGSTASTNFPLVAPLQATFGGGALDGFVSKLNASGSTLAYSTYLGGGFTDEALGVASSSAGVATVVGYTSSTNFPLLGATQVNLASAGHTDAFVSRLGSSGSSLVYSTYLGGTGDDSASSVGIDSLGTAYLVGSTTSADLPTSRAIAGQGVYHGASDGFVAAIDSVDSQLGYLSYLGGSDEDHAVSVAVESGGTTHIVGNTFSTDFPVMLAPIARLVGSQDAFVTQLPGVSISTVPAGNRWNWVLLASLLLGAGLVYSSTSKKRFA